MCIGSWLHTMIGVCVGNELLPSSNDEEDLSSLIDMKSNDDIFMTSTWLMVSCARGNLPS